jgi:hypothetical protein
MVILGVVLNPNAVRAVATSVDVLLNWTVRVLPLRVKTAVAVLPGNPEAV